MEFISKLKHLFGIEDAPFNGSKAPADEESPAPARTVKPPSYRLPPAPERREEIVRFIVHALRPYTDEKNHAIRGIRFYPLCTGSEEEELTRVALYADKPGKFQREELQRKLANNYIRLPENWFFEFSIVKDVLPDCRIKQDLFGLEIVDNLQHAGNFPTARLVVLEGQTSETEYLLDPNRKLKYYIGRGQNPVLESGRVHTNDVIFFEKDDLRFDEIKGRANLFVSRNHAYIVYSPPQDKYFLYVDKGGLPSHGNKTKLLKAGETERTERLDIIGAAHELADGDQIELGGEGKLLFSTNF